MASASYSWWRAQILCKKKKSWSQYRVACNKVKAKIWVFSLCGIPVVLLCLGRIEIRIRWDVLSAYNRTQPVLKAWQSFAIRPPLPQCWPSPSPAGVDLKRKKIINLLRKSWHSYLKKTKSVCFSKTASHQPEADYSSFKKMSKYLLHCHPGMSHSNGGSRFQGRIWRVSQEPFVTELATRWQPSRGPSERRAAWPLRGRACGGRSAWKRITDSSREC